jgi:beta-lactamase superfamily II metal-dependent hydrolase
MFCMPELLLRDLNPRPYALGLRGWRGVTRDVSHRPRIAQFRIDLRSVDGGGSFSDPAQRGETHRPDPGEEAVATYLWSRGFQQIDVVALTRAHQDHIGGLTAIFGNFFMDRVKWRGTNWRNLKS